jgi:hypothetical protein
LGLPLPRAGQNVFVFWLILVKNGARIKLLFVEPYHSNVKRWYLCKTTFHWREKCVLLLGWLVYLDHDVFSLQDCWKPEEYQFLHVWFTTLPHRRYFVILSPSTSNKILSWIDFRHSHTYYQNFNIYIELLWLQKFMQTLQSTFPEDVPRPKTPLMNGRERLGVSR